MKEQRPWNKPSQPTPWRKTARFGVNRYDGEFYNSYQWRQFRKYVISTRPQICVQCGKFARYLDHIVPLRLGGARLDPDNVQWLCGTCHTGKTNKERND